MEQILADNLLRLRKARGYRTQEAMAEATGLPFRTYQDIERGKSWPQKRNIEAIAHCLSVHPSLLFADPEAVRKPSPQEALEVLREALAQPPAIPGDITDRLLALPPDRRESVLNRVREILEVESPPPQGGGAPSAPGAKSPLRSKA